MTAQSTPTPGAVIRLRSATWKVLATSTLKLGYREVHCRGLSGLVRDKEARFVWDLEKGARVLDPAAIQLVPDSSPGLIDTKLHLAAAFQATPTTTRRPLTLGRAAIDDLTFQHLPVERALSQDRVRLLIADDVGLGKTLEAGLITSELALRGRANRILVVTTRAMLTQFQKEFWTRFSIPLSRLDSAAIRRMRNLPYTAVIVDEAQDMGEQAFRLIRAIVPENLSEDKNSLFIVGDAHQRIYGRRAAMSACGINVRGRSKRLRLNYRTTQEIRAWAVSILEGVNVDDLDEGTDSLRGYISLMRGVAPELVGCRSEAEELDGLVAWVRSLPTDQIRLAEIGVLCARRVDTDRVQGALRAAGIETVILQSGADDRSVPGVRITTMHRAKGLEFFAVAIPFLSDGSFPPQGPLKSAVDAADRDDIIAQHRSLLHVAATRAKKALRVSWSGQPTSLIRGPA